MKANLLKLTTVVLVFFAMQSCKKESILDFYTSSEDVTTNQSIDLIAEDEADSFVFNFADNGVAQDRGCGVVTYQKPKGTFPNVITIDFGTGCTDLNGREKKGKLVVNVSGDMKLKGSSRTITPDNFFVDGVQVEGSRTLTNTGTDLNGFLCFTRVVDNQKLTFPGGAVASWSSATKLCQTEGGGTKERLDDVFSITGSSNGVNRKGVAFNAEITEALIKKTACPWFVQGKSKLSDANREVTIDYGDGSCDKKAVVTLPNGTTKEIQIRRWW